ncbi:MAG TPA: thioesterase family protein [Bacillota bacterium]|nr:thioesterase family protein [Bacillota bacterium]
MYISETEVDVRYAETDAMQIVHHANYLVWFELGRTKYMEDLGISYASVEQRGFLLPVLEITAKYKKPFRYGETAIIKTTIQKYDGLRVIYNYAVVDKQGELHVEGTSSHVIVTKEKFKPINIKKHLPDLHEIFETKRI